jgi:hypothetical protein
MTYYSHCPARHSPHAWRTSSASSSIQHASIARLECQGRCVSPRKPQAGRESHCGTPVLSCIDQSLRLIIRKPQSSYMITIRKNEHPFSPCTISRQDLWKETQVDCVSRETLSWPRVSWDYRQNHLRILQLYLICLLPSPGLSPGLHPAGFRFGPLLLLWYAVVRVSSARRHDNAGCRPLPLMQVIESELRASS